MCEFQGFPTHAAQGVTSAFFNFIFSHYLKSLRTSSDPQLEGALEVTYADVC